MKDWSVDILKDFWVKLGCFITGYSYTLIRNSSEASRKTVKKFLSAIILIGTIWFAVGYLFANRYFDASQTLSIFAGVVMVILVVQIERQIMLTGNLNIGTKVSRFLLGLLMALVGATVIDQVIFKDDVERYKLDNADEVVEKRVAQQRDLLNGRLAEFQKAQNIAVAERNALLQDIEKRPFIKTYTTKTNTERDTSGNLQVTETQRNEAVLENPNIRILTQKNSEIEKLEDRKAEIAEKTITLYNDEREKLMQEREGFLTELQYLWEIISSSWIAMGFYVMWFLLLVLIEMLVLIAKGGSGSTDYERLIQHQSDVNKRSIDSLSNDT